MPAQQQALSVSGHASDTLKVATFYQKCSQIDFDEVHYLANFVLWDKTSFVTSFTSSIIIWSFSAGRQKMFKKKFNWTLQLISTIERVPSKYFQHMEGTDGIYEIRVEVASNIFRAFAFFDEGQLIVIANAFQKKTQKTPKNELELAKPIKKEYFDEKSKK